MKKIKVAFIAIIDGLLIIAALVSTILGLMYSVSISAEYLLLMLTPAPVFWIHFKLNKICNKINGFTNEDN